jgi:hypothetical protein
VQWAPAGQENGILFKKFKPQIVAPLAQLWLYFNAPKLLATKPHAAGGRTQPNLVIDYRPWAKRTRPSADAEQP